MANIVITSKGTNGIYVDFGVYASSELLSPQGFNTANIEHIEPCTTGVCVKTSGRDPQTWQLCHTAIGGYMIVDDIDGVGVSSQSDLIDKLTALM